MSPTPLPTVHGRRPHINLWLVAVVGLADYVASLVEVTGPGHPNGVPLVGFYRVRHGKVIRHVFMDAEHK